MIPGSFLVIIGFALASELHASSRDEVSTRGPAREYIGKHLFVDPLTAYRRVYKVTVFSYTDDHLSVHKSHVFIPNATSKYPMQILVFLIIFTIMLKSMSLCFSVGNTESNVIFSLFSMIFP